VNSSPAMGVAAKAMQMVGDIARWPSRQDLSRQGGAPGGVRRLRRDLPRHDGLLHISEVSRTVSQRARRVEGRRSDLVKVLALEGNKIKLSRKAVLREQREKLKSGKP